MACSHLNVAVDYDHPYQLVTDIAVADLKAMSAEDSREVMTIANPRCIDCGEELQRSEIAPRVLETGDLYDPRFRWVFRRPG